MFNILDFIDSKDIRDYNQYTQFTPIEQAYLIYYSRRTTVDEKMAAWQELLETYREDEFALTCFGEVKFYEDRSNRRILEDMVSAYESTIALQNCTEGIVFEAISQGNQCACFPDYHSAFAYLKEQKQEYAKIRARGYGKNDWYSNVFHFDRELRLIHLWPSRDLFVSEQGTLRYLSIYIPTPFERGDIVRLITSDTYKYGVLVEAPDKEYCVLQNEEQSLEALHDVRIDCFEADDAHGHFNFHHCKVLELEKCSEKELPEDQKILGFLSSVYKGQSQIGDFLYSYSYHGKEARIF